MSTNAIAVAAITGPVVGVVVGYFTSARNKAIEYDLAIRADRVRVYPDFWIATRQLTTAGSLTLEELVSLRDLQESIYFEEGRGIYLGARSVEARVGLVEDLNNAIDQCKEMGLGASDAIPVEVRTEIATSCHYFRRWMKTDVGSRYRSPYQRAFARTPDGLIDRIRVKRASGRKRRIEWRPPPTA